jgi:hypothetical protein
MNRLNNLAQHGAALRLRRLAPWGLVGFLAVGCLVDEDDKCGENQVLWTNGQRCVCAEGFVASADGSCVTAAPPAPGAPTGVGTPCASDADCAAFDADYCELAVSRTCLVQNCTVSPNSCFQGFTCCSFAGVPGFESIPNICLVAGLC